MILVLLIFAPILIALGNYLLNSRITRNIAGILQLAVFAVCLYLFIGVRFFGRELYLVTGSVASLGIPLALTTLSALFVLLTAFIFTVSLLYTLTRESTHGLFVFLLFSLQALIFTAFLSDDLFNIYLALEISAILCSMLILYNRTIRSLYDGMVYLLTNMVGMLFFLMGIGYMYKMFGVLNLSTLAAAVASFDNPGALALPYAFLMTGIALKCAFMPLHAWLPKAHGTPGAPAVVSAILSGIYVKCGIFLFIRLRLLFLPQIDADLFFLIVGFITGLAGIVLALLQTDIKLILAYHTISQIGLILIGISLGSEYAFGGAILHVVNHALFKSLLFLCAGILIKEYGTRNLYEIRGVLRSLPAIAIALIAGILGITGAPFFNGSISKYFIQAGGSQSAWWAQLFVIIINTGTILSFVKFGSMLYGDSRGKTFSCGDAPANAALWVLAASCLLTGLFGQDFMNLTLGYAFPINMVSYALKALVWLASIAGGILVYKYGISRAAFFHRPHNPELMFGTMNLMTLLFFASVLAFVLFFPHSAG